jgi:Clp protease
MAELALPMCLGAACQCRHTTHLLASAVQINTVAVGVAIGQSCMLLSAGTKGHRFMLPHATGSSSAVRD